MLKRRNTERLLRLLAGLGTVLLVFPTSGCHSANPNAPCTGIVAERSALDNAAAARAITTLLTTQANDWNSGDLDAFASGYKNSPDILFIGRKVSHGYDQMLAGYRHGYPTREAMGTLTFSQLEVQPLDPRFATVTGHYHLGRSARGGGNADGYFLLVLENTASGWKVVRDDTTSLPSA